MEWDEFDEVPGSDEGEELLPVVPHEAASSSVLPSPTAAGCSLSQSPYSRFITPPRKRRKLDHTLSDDDDEDPLRLRPGDFVRQDNWSTSPIHSGPSSTPASLSQPHFTPSRRSAPPTYTPTSSPTKNVDPRSGTPSSRADTPPWSTSPTAASPPRLINDDALSNSSPAGSRDISPLTDLDQEDAPGPASPMIAQERLQLPWSQLDDDDLAQDTGSAEPAIEIPAEAAGRPEEEQLEIPPELIESRYPKRRRTEQQLQPYKWDQAMYKNTLRNNHDAQVSAREIRQAQEESRLDRYEDDGDAPDDDDNQSEGQVSPARRRRQSRSRSRSATSRHEDDASAVDDGDSSPAEDAEVAVYRKEAQRLRAQQEKEEKEKRKREAQQRREENKQKLLQKRAKERRAKEFPISANDDEEKQAGPSSRRDSSARLPPHRRPRSPSPPPTVEDLPTSRRRLRRGSTSSLPRPVSTSPPPRQASSSSRTTQPSDSGLDDLFSGGENTAFDHGSWSPRSMDMEIDDPPNDNLDNPYMHEDTEQSSSEESSEEEELERTAEALERFLAEDPGLRRHRKYLGRLFPAQIRDEYTWDLIERGLEEARDRERAQLGRKRKRAGPLEPGQTRHGRSKAAMFKPIKGDIESDEEERRTPPSTPSPSSTVRPLSPAPRPASSRQRRKHKHKASTGRRRTEPVEVIDISSDGDLSNGSDISSDDDIVEDEEIAQFVERHQAAAPSTNGTVRERNQVDYMLERTFVHGAPRGVKPKKAKQKRSGKSRRASTPKASAGHRSGGHSKSGGDKQRGHRASKSGGRETPTTSRPRLSRQHGDNGTSAHRQTSLAEFDFDMEPGSGHLSDNEPQAPPNPFARAVAQVPKKRQKKKKKKAPTKQPPYTFGGQHVIEPGLYRHPRQFEMFLQHEGFNEQLGSKQSTPDPSRPPSQPWQLQNGQASSPRSGDPLSPLPGIDPTQSSASAPRPYQNLDLSWVGKLNGRVSFAPTTYIGKGYIDELIRVIKGDTQPTEPHPFIYNTFTLDSSCTTATFLESLRAFRQELSTEPIAQHGEEDLTQALRLQGAVRAHCHCLSWLLRHRPADEVTFITHQVETEVQSLLAQASSQSAGPVTHMALMVSWFAVEAIARLGRKVTCIELTIDEESIYRDALSHLCLHLIRFGTLDSCAAVNAGGDTLDSKHLGQRTAELWISLQHLTAHTVTVSTQGATSSPSHPLGVVAFFVIRREMQADLPFRQAERRWQIIFGLCYLSQFTTTGRSHTEQRFATSWSLVADALKSVDFGVNKELEPGSTPDKGRKLLDEYAGQLIRRCAHLWNFWGWGLATSGSVLAQLLAVFRTRKYSNLIEEAIEFPEFLKTDPSLLFKADATCNTALEMYIKLAFFALVDGKQAYHPMSMSDRVPQTTARKLSSSFSPTSQLMFSRDHPPFQEDKSSMINRFAIIAMYIALEPAKAGDMLTKLQGYMDFSNMEITARAICIRGAMYLGMFLIRINLSPDPSLSWLAKMLETLMNELPSAPKEHRSQATGGDPPLRVKMAIITVLQAMTKVLMFHASCARYDIPLSFLQSDVFASRFFGFSPEAREIVERTLPPYVVREFIQACLDTLPNKQKQAVVTTEAESQDEYAEFDAMFSTDGFMEALDMQEGMTTQPTAEEGTIVKFVKERVLFLVYLMTQKRFSSPDDTLVNVVDYANDANAWIKCWLSCAAALVRNRLSAWENFIDLARESTEVMTDLAWRARLWHFVMHNTLSIDPDILQNSSMHGDYAVVTLNCLITPPSPSQSEFLDSLRGHLNASEEEDGIFHGVQFPTPHAYTSAQHLAAQRVRAIRSMCDNCEQLLLTRSFSKSPAVAYLPKYSEAFSDALLTMKETYSAKQRANADDYDSYAAFCKDVAAAVSDHKELKASLTNNAAQVLHWGTTL